MITERKIALVTGASRGIGRAIATRLAKEGILVAVHYGERRGAALEVVEEIKTGGGDAFAIGADVATVAGVARLYEQFKTELARSGATGFDILVNNAGVTAYGTITDTDEATYDRMFDINMKAMFFSMQHAVPLLHDGGRIINLSSVVSLTAYPQCIAYGAVKAAVNSLTRSAALGLGPRNITVNAVAPGATETDFIAAVMEDDSLVKSIESVTALGRLGKPNDIAEVVNFLASPAGAWITGQLIVASGGMSI
jgi:NAD(P)-dependent dehydrogenase (short-subunit alcohol dehydrogenase family)